MSFEFSPTRIPDVVLIRPTRHRDGRGFFQETYRRSVFADAGIDATFVQDNVAHSAAGVLRGLHYQLPPADQGKLVWVPRGEVFDVVVDLRRDSAYHGEWVGCRLDAEGGAMLWIPSGFAHGYVSLADDTTVAYKVTAQYEPELDRGIRWDDPELDIEWPVTDPVLSAKDRQLPSLAEAENPF